MPTGDPKALARIRKELERRALILSSSEHTAKGHHAAVLRSWRSWVPPDVARASSALSFDDAAEALREAGLTFV